MATATIYDLEYTAWEGSLARRWMAPGEFRELVQIGAVKVDAASLETVDTFEILVKPRINGVISPYLERLTGITNAAIAARSVDFVEAYEGFVAFARTGPICAFGRDDRILTDCIRLYGIKDAPPLPRHINIFHYLFRNGVDARGHHACDIARLCGVAFEGRAHDALDDARSIALGLRALLERGAPGPFAGPFAENQE